MLENKIEILPRILSDRELVNFAERHLDKPNGMPIDYQKELLARLQKRLENN